MDIFRLKATMRNWIWGLTLFLLVGCDNDDDFQCIGDPLPQPFLFVNLVNQDGVNLFDNGTYDPDDIVVRFDDITIQGLVFSDIPELAKLIAIPSLFRDTPDPIPYYIDLSVTQTDTLIMDVTRMRLGEGRCSTFLNQINGAIYNSTVQNLIRVEEGFQIDIEKE